MQTSIDLFTNMKDYSEFSKLNINIVQIENSKCFVEYIRLLQCSSDKILIQIDLNNTKYYDKDFINDYVSQYDNVSVDNVSKYDNVSVNNDSQYDNVSKYDNVSVDNDSQYDNVSVDNVSKYDNVSVNNDSQYDNVSVDNVSKYDNVSVDNDIINKNLHIVTCSSMFYPSEKNTDVSYHILLQDITLLNYVENKKNYSCLSKVGDYFTIYKRLIFFTENESIFNCNILTCEEQEKQGKTSTHDIDFDIKCYKDMSISKMKKIIVIANKKDLNFKKISKGYTKFNKEQIVLLIEKNYEMIEKMFKK